MRAALVRGLRQTGVGKRASVTSALPYGVFSKKRETPETPEAPSFMAHLKSLAPLPGLTLDIRPALIPGASGVLPISLSRYYDASPEQVAAYDRELDLLLTHTGDLVEEGKLSASTVITTGLLQGINWGSKLAQEKEGCFLRTHAKQLSRQSGVYKWDEWLPDSQQSKLEKYYKLVSERSSEGSEWYDLMVKTHKNVAMSTDLGKSIEYQRREYAAIMAMGAQYDQLLYTGSISLAWAYTYHKINWMKLPLFTRVSFLKQPQSVEKNLHRLVKSIETAFTNPRLKAKDRQFLAESVVKQVYTYGYDFPEKPQQDADLSYSGVVAPGC